MKGNARQGCSGDKKPSSGFLRDFHLGVDDAANKPSLVGFRRSLTSTEKIPHKGKG